MASIEGPFGGSGGEAWNDWNSYTGIQAIRVSYTSDYIASFSVVYYINDTAWEGPRHYAGVGDAYTHQTITLNTGENITKVTGYIAPLPNTNKNVVCSLSFTTDRSRVFEVNSNTRGQPFEAKGTKIIGFFGRTSPDYMDAIGVYKVA